MQVDTAGFEAEMETQRQRSKDCARTVDLTADSVLRELAEGASTTAFLGYAGLSAEARVVGLVAGGEPVATAAAGQVVDVILDRTPFYAESGGQIGDQGLLAAASAGNSSSSSSGGGSGGDGRGPAAAAPVAAAVVVVTDVQKAAGGGLVVHKCEVQSGRLEVGARVSAEVDAMLRKRAMCSHTATHLLQSALKEVLGADTSQQVGLGLRA